MKYHTSGSASKREEQFSNSTLYEIDKEKPTRRIMVTKSKKKEDEIL